eukprot:scaffold65849_cov44-Attheya_sp.AAC.2
MGFIPSPDHEERANMGCWTTLLIMPCNLEISRQKNAETRERSLNSNHGLAFKCDACLQTGVGFGAITKQGYVIDIVSVPYPQPSSKSRSEIAKKRMDFYASLNTKYEW